MSKPVFVSIEEAHKYFKNITDDRFKTIVLRRGLNVREIENDDLDSLKKKKDLILILLRDNSLLIRNVFSIRRPGDFEIVNSEYEQSSLSFSIKNYLKRIYEDIEEKINVLEQNSKVESIKNLVGDLPENDLKQKLKDEISQLEAKKRELELIKEEEKEKLNDEIELGKHKTDMFVKKTDVFLKFLDRESVASIVGSLLLLTMGICLIIIMFRREEPLKIIESAFLLILGYFFGHSKNNK